MDQTNRTDYSAISGAIGGFVVGFIYPLIFFFDSSVYLFKQGYHFYDAFSELFNAALIIGLGSMILFAIAGAIKGNRKKDNSSTFSWILMGIFATFIASLPMLPFLYLGFSFSNAYNDEDSIYLILAFLPVTYAMGAFGGFISGKIFQKIEIRYNSKKK